VSFFPHSIFSLPPGGTDRPMNPLARTMSDVFQGAGLVPVQAEVLLPHLTLKYWSPQREGELLEKEVKPSGKALDLFFFWMPQCESCFESMKDLARVSQDPRWQAVLKIEAVAMETDLTAYLKKSAEDTHWPQGFLVDAKGGLAERLAVLGAPGVVISDKNGNIVARFNGDIDFQSPGFELLLSRVRQVQSQAITEVMKSEVKATPILAAKVLGVPITGYFFLFAALLICYPMAKSVIRRRKNIATSKKST
jgi:thioredoxin-related protein